MRITCRAYRVSAEQIEVAPGADGVDPDVLAALDDKWKLLISRDLVLLFEVNKVFELWLCRQSTFLGSELPVPT